MTPLVWLVLAAGRSTRFGADKLMAQLPDGRRLIDSTLDRLESARQTDRIQLVTRPDNLPLQQHLDLRGTPWLGCPHAAEGLGAVIAWSNQAIAADAWLGILPGDQPLIDPNTFVQLRERRSPGRLLAPRHQNQRGHPVLFPPELRRHLQGLQGDHGARDVLTRLSDLVTLVDVEDAGVVTDCDTPDALAACFSRCGATDHDQGHHGPTLRPHPG